MQVKEYALYKGEELLAMGTKREIAEQLGVSVNSDGWRKLMIRTKWLEVEKEPRYTVRIKGIDGYSKYLNRDTKTQKWFFASKTELERFRAHHTRKELESNGFGWVFSCEGVEVKEVEKEPRYTVRIKGIDGYSKYLNRDTKTQKWFFASKTELERFRAHHTRKELESNGFGWVFSCEGVEVKEVE